MNMEHSEHLLHTALLAAIHAGADIMRIYTDPSQDFGIEKKADNSPLTLADKAAHQRIMTYLEPTGIPVLSEEGKHLPYQERQLWKKLWIVDPLDGTKEFIKKNGEFTVNIALVEDHTPVMGVIYVPAQGRLYWGQPGSGAFTCLHNCAQPLPTAEKLMAGATPLPLAEEQHEGFVVVASRSHLTLATQAFIDEMQKTHPDVRTASSGSSLKICMVAEGTADAYPRYAPTMEWDTAAGDAIARAARCRVIDSETGKPLCYNKADLLNPWFLVDREN